MSDVEITAAEHRAIEELERRLRPTTTLQNPYAFAEQFITDMRAEGWRPPLKPAQPWKTAAVQPPASAQTRAAVLEELRSQDWYQRAAESRRPNGSA
ncbi:hypothetical protein [Spirillospora sp. NBC_01491]|uniref:hypothetical protein n=1 Tax=Spirillospora sp. NBC_01491 TaxID=2976007 RepID=UPI002E37CD4E|nr:hypothetical protein [Spirillospora sp. NBC_01491]